MSLVTIYALEHRDQVVSEARFELARELTESVAVMVARVINSLTGKGDMTKDEVFVNPAVLDSATWNVPPLWLHVRPGRTALLEEKVHQLRNLLSEGFRSLLLGRYGVQEGEVDAFDVEVTFLDGCGHTMGLDGKLLASWGDTCEADKTVYLMSMRGDRDATAVK